MVATMKPAGSTAPFTDAEPPGVAFAIVRPHGRPVGEAFTSPDMYAEPAPSAGAAN